MVFERPNPPVVGKVTHYTIALEWAHVKATLPSDIKFKYRIQESNVYKKAEWSTVYTGLGICTTIKGLEPSTIYKYRLCYMTSNTERSEFSQPIEVKTTKEPINGEELQKAIITDNSKNVEALVNSPNGHRLFDIPDNAGNLPLMIVIKNNTSNNHSQVQMLRLLIELGADVDAQNDNLRTALMMAAFFGKLSLVKLLKHFHASYNLRDNSGMTALHYAIDGGDIDTINYMLQTGADVNAVDIQNGWSPLIRAACMNADAEVAHILIKHNADVNILDNEKKSALMIATINGNVPFVDILLKNKADIYITNKFGKSLYELAKSMDRIEMIEFLDEYMASNQIKKIRSRKFSMFF